MKKSLPNLPDFLATGESPFLQPKIGSKRGPFPEKFRPNHLKLIEKALAWKVLLKKQIPSVGKKR